MGGIYLGIATPTEAAALGVVGAMLIAAMNRTLSIAMLHAAFLSALRATAMVVLVVTCAYVLNFSLSLAGIPQALSEYIGELGWSPIATIWALVIFRSEEHTSELKSLMRISYAVSCLKKKKKY